MSIKKGYCTKCNKHDETRRIFDVNTDAKICHCPHCGKTYKPKMAVQNYERALSKYLRRGYYFLKNVGNPQTAYATFAHVLELDPKNKTAKLGRLLSLAYISTLRRNRFLEVKELLLMDSEIFKAHGIRREYTAFLLGLHRCVADYMTRAKKKLTLKDYFYDVNCLKLYYHLIPDALEILRVTSNELSMIEEEKFASNVNDSIKLLENEYNLSFFTVDGQEQHLVNFTKTGEPLIVNGRKKEDTTKLQRYRMATLDTNNKKLRQIDDQIFTRVYHKMHKMMKAALALFIVSLVVGAAILVVYFIFIKNAAALIALIFAIIFGAVALGFLGIRLIFQYILRKPKI